MCSPNFLNLFIIFLINTPISQEIQCKDENNNPVDSFYTYKFPEVKKSTIWPLNEGGAYAFITSGTEGTTQKWTFSNHSLESDTNIIANTLAPLYGGKQDYLYVLYNDEPPNQPTDEHKGHTKGVILSDEFSGIWLVHSVPHFPELSQNYTYPSTGKRYGQSFLCLSLDLENINKVGLQIQYNQVHIYQSNIPESLKGKVKNVEDAVNGVSNITFPWYHITDLATNANWRFVSFAKASNFNQELYMDLVAPSLMSNLYTETWLNGKGRLTSNCSGTYWVKNIKSIELCNITFRSSEDHSKWAVAGDDSTYWICVGDINRQAHQLRRGGGTVCHYNENISKAYREIISTKEDCSATNYYYYNYMISKL